jgi:hypothetical protein
VYALLQIVRPHGITISFSDVHHQQKHEMSFHNKVGYFDPDRNFTWTVTDRAPAILALPAPSRRRTADKVIDWLRANW